MTRIQIRRGTAAQWADINPVLFQGEFGFEVDTSLLKLGDGTTAWNSLPYIALDWATLPNKPSYIAAGSSASAARSAVEAEWTGNKGQPDGYASLDSNGLIPQAQLPIDPPDWATLEGRPTYIAAGATKAEAREAIDAEYIVASGTTGQYYRGDKSWQTLDKTAVGLSNVDNTSDSTKNAASATLTNKTISGSDNALSNIPQSAVTGLSTSLSGKQDTSEKGQANGYASLDGGGKVPVSQLPNSIMLYQGTWNATTNTPTLADGTGDPGDVYRVTTAGSQNLGSGSISFVAGDYVIYNGTVWEKADTTDAVASINGYTGEVSLTKSDVGLGNVDNTSDADKNSATATLTNKTISGSSNTLTDIGLSSLSTTGTAGSSTYLRGDGTWATISVPQSTSYTTTVGDGSSTDVTVTHNLNTRNVVVSVKDALTYAEVECDVTASSANAVTLTFATAPTLGQYRATVLSDGIMSNPTTTSWLASSTIKDDTDQTKQVSFQVSGVSTGTTRVLAVPNANTTIVGTDATQTLTNKTISGSSNTLSNIGVSSLSATGSASSSTYLRGDGSWAAPASGISTGKAIAMAMVFG